MEAERKENIKVYISALLLVVSVVLGREQYGEEHVLQTVVMQRPF